MRPFAFFFAAFGFNSLCLLGAMQLHAAAVSSSQCMASGGCGSACVNGSSDSSNIICQSQLPQCSPAGSMSTCNSTAADTYAVCGTYYHYTAKGCDPTTIDNSYYKNSYYCSSGN